MTAILFVLAVVALVGYGLERNHRRQTRLGPGLSGSANAEDRDLSRVAADLRATATRTTANPAQARPTTRRPTATVHSVHTA